MWQKKLKNSKCDEFQKMKMWQKTKKSELDKNVTKLKNNSTQLKYNKTKKIKFDKTKKKSISDKPY